MPETDSMRRVMAVLSIALSAALLLAGCTSDEPGPVGTGIPGELDVGTPSTTRVTTLAPAGHVILVDQDVPFDQTGALYFGHDEEDSSSILVRYDLSSLPDSFPDWTQMDEETVVRAELRLLRLKFYAPDTTAADFDPDDYEHRYLVNALTEPLDTSLYPGPEPDYGPLFADETLTGQEPTIDLSVTTILDWAENGTNGIIIHEGEGSTGRLLGFGSRDMEARSYGEIPQLSVGSTIGISLAVTVYDTLTVPLDAETDTTYVLDEILVFKAIADVSTLHVQPTPSADLSSDIELQTHQRISPYFAFSPLVLPENTYVNRAVIRMAVDFDRTFGKAQSLVLNELAPSLVVGVDTLSLQTLGDEAVPATGQYSVDYAAMAENELDWVGWDVTSTVQRIVNGVLDPDTVFLLTAGETFSGYLNTSAYDPDFYFSRYVLRGTDEAELVPHLEITYTPFSGGGQ